MPLTVDGIAFLNDRPAPGGVTLLFVRAADTPVVCGRTATRATARFTFEATPECPPGTRMIAQLTDVGVVSEQSFTVDRTSRSIFVEFQGLSDEQLVAVGAMESPPDETAADQRATPLIDRFSLTFILVLVIIATVVISLALVIQSRKGVDVTKQTEAMVLTGVIIAVILLGVTGRIGSDGLISVLAAIVGWTAARTLAGGGEPAGVQPQPTKPQPEPGAPANPQPEPGAPANPQPGAKQPSAATTPRTTAGGAPGRSGGTPPAGDGSPAPFDASSADDE